MASLATELNYAWAGGLFEGEGSVGYQGPSGLYGRRSPKLVLGQNDKAVLERFAKAIGCGRIYECNRPTGLFYSWQTTTYKDYRKGMARLYPWVGDRRRARMKDALLVSMLPRGISSKEALSKAGKKGAKQRWNKEVT